MPEAETAGRAPVPNLSTPGRSTPRMLLAGLVVLVAGTVVGLARQPGPGAFDTVWAEDGTVFLSDALRYSPWETLRTPYAGYLHLLPRLLAEAAALFPISWAAGVLAVQAALVTTGLALAVFAASRRHLGSPVLSLLVAVPVVVLPLGQGELPNSIANLHWPALYATFWMLLWNPSGGGGGRYRPAVPALVAALVAGLTAASDPLSVVFVPLALGRARLVVVRGWSRGLVPAVFLAGLAVQGAARLFAHAPRELAPNPDPVWAGAAYALRVVPLTLVGERSLGPGISTTPGYLVLVALAWLVVVAVVGLALLRLTRPDWRLAALAAGHSTGLYLLSTMLSGMVVPRYAAAPALLLLTALAALLRPSVGPSGGRPWAAGALLAVVLVVCAVNLRVPNPRAEGPSWSGALDQARQTCAAAGSAGEVAVALTPEGWTARLPCRVLSPRESPRGPAATVFRSSPAAGTAARTPSGS